ncbi:MAG: serine hydrolase, partial [Bacteroidota bacterium]|nr:serine hydrolase [Bacteroidota bacterium]
MIYNLRNSLILFALLILILGCSSNPTTTEKRKERMLSDEQLDSIALIYNPQKADKRIDDFVGNLHRRSGFNGNVLVAKNGKIIYEKAIGWADHLYRDSLKISSVFELASV